MMLMVIFSMWFSTKSQNKRVDDLGKRLDDLGQGLGKRTDDLRADMSKRFEGRR